MIAACTGGEREEDARIPVPTTAAPAYVTGIATRTAWPDGQPVQQSQWVRDRLAAVKTVFRFTPAGEEWIDGYDFRQMVEQPAWFGSHGYKSWAGAGEAVPRSVLHEISHSYWGAFSVDLRPELSWDGDDGPAPALLAYRDDLDRFLRQPPDRYEPLRDRFRNLPGLNTGDYPDLFHFGEADLLYMTGGNLQLIPPILRPYFSGFLLTGGAGALGGNAPESWDVALSWFNSLSGEEHRIAGEVFGLQHFPVSRYRDLPDSKLSGLDVDMRTVYENEEKQRLIDFVEQFDGILDREFALVDASGADRGFDFWRSYLSDKLALHARYPDVLANTGSERGRELTSALDLYSDIDRVSPEEQVVRFRSAQNQPLVPELAVLLKPRAIVDLFSDPASGGGIATVLGTRADRLAALVDVVERVDQINASAFTGPVAAAVELEQFMRSIPEGELQADIFLLLDLLRSGDAGLAADVLPALTDDALRFLLGVQPAAARAFEISPERLLRAVGIVDSAPLEQVRSGATLLAANSSGNFAIDAAYDEAVFSHLDRFVRSDPAEVLSAVIESGTRLVPWITRESDGALEAMRMAPVAAADALASLSGSRETPWRIVHLVAGRDPGLAATLTAQLAEPSRKLDGAVGNVIREFAYDSYWSERGSGPNVKPAALKKFLLSLVTELGEQRVQGEINEAVATTAEQMITRQVDADYRDEFGRTAQAALDVASGKEAESLRRIFLASGLLSG